MMIVDVFCNSNKEGSSIKVAPLPFLSTSSFLPWLSNFFLGFLLSHFCSGKLGSLKFVVRNNKNLLRNLLKRVRKLGHDLKFGPVGSEVLGLCDVHGQLHCLMVLTISAETI